MKRLKKVLKIWAREHCANISERVIVAKQKLVDVQKLLVINAYDVALLEEENKCKKDFTGLLKMEYEELRQKTNCTWMLNGDKYTAIFHSLLKNTRLGTSYGLYRDREETNINTRGSGAGW
ncbi:hypothetical protein FRX31_013959 [Thalictrum thalictroides]|uniref:Uncharacterized protein n=1 Tax=Thalictrum thalictroides TaxID=46969 RepID=A0A7J6WGB5_THATH|nr:hypothetical protein FRX31_013959 [Thalictrum thalictroides]